MFAVLVFACCGRAHASIVLSIIPPTESGVPGGSNVVFTGSVYSTDPGPFAFDSAGINLLTGPAGADLTTFPISRAAVDAPLDSITDAGYNGPIFEVAIDPAALTGAYTLNFNISYGGQPVGADTTVNVISPLANPVPEPSGAVIVLLGASLVGVLGVCRRKLAMRIA